MDDLFASASAVPVNYHEGSDVGYRWFERTKAKPLFPFGFGLTYTQFRHSDLKVSDGDQLEVTLTVTNVGKRAGIDVPQLYVAPPGRTHRLAGWARVELQPGETRQVTISADPKMLASWTAKGWRRASGSTTCGFRPPQIFPACTPRRL